MCIYNQRTIFSFYLNYCQYHELIGLEVEVENLFNLSYHKMTGTIIDETKNMFKIKTLENKLKMIPKRGLIFIFKIPRKLTNNNDTVIKINGNNLISSPQNRTKSLKKLIRRN